MAPIRFSISHHFFLPSLLFILLLFSVHVESRVPKNQTFQYINQGQYGDPFVEYYPSYRFIKIHEKNFYTYPFWLCFYNTTPNAYIFGLGAGAPQDQEFMRWVWDANPNDPVRENATLTFGRDGNLVLADADGRIAWQTNTANKGVTGISLESNGNLVLKNKKGRYVWQSFSHPSNTLLLGQSLMNTGRNKLVSRRSKTDSRDGPYSLVVDEKGFTMYVNNSGSIVQHGGSWGGEGLVKVTFNAFNTLDGAQSSTTYELVLESRLLKNSSNPLFQPRRVSTSSVTVLKKIEYNAIEYTATDYSFMRLELDGNLKIYTYYTSPYFQIWSQPYAYW